MRARSNLLKGPKPRASKSPAGAAAVAEGELPGIDGKSACEHDVQVRNPKCNSKAESVSQRASKAMPEAKRRASMLQGPVCRGLVCFFEQWWARRALSVDVSFVPGMIA